MNQKLAAIQVSPVRKAPQGNTSAGRAPFRRHNRNQNRHAPVCSACASASALDRSPEPEYSNSNNGPKRQVNTGRPRADSR